MNRLKSFLVPALALSVGFTNLHAGPADDKAMAAAVTTQAVPDPFYVEIGGGAVFLNTPKKNNDNLYTDVGAMDIDGANDATGNFKTDSIGGSVDAKFGYILESHPSESWLGSNLRVEGFGNYFQSGTSAAGAYSTAGNPGPINAYWIQALNGSGGNYIGVFQESPQVRESSNDYFYEGGTALKSDFTLANGKIVITPSLALDYSHLGQHFETSATGDAGFFNQGEKINTEYYGLDFGVEARTHLTKQLSTFVDAGITPMIASSSYHGQQFVDGGTGVTSSTANDSTTVLTFRANVEGGFCYDLGPVSLKLSGGVQYWDYAATVREAELPIGSPIFGPSDSSHLVSGSMLNPEVNASVVVPF